MAAVSNAIVRAKYVWDRERAMWMLVGYRRFSEMIVLPAEQLAKARRIDHP